MMFRKRHNFISVTNINLSTFVLALKTNKCINKTGTHENRFVTTQLSYR